MVILIITDYYMIISIITDYYMIKYLFLFLFWKR